MRNVCEKTWIMPSVEWAASVLTAVPFSASDL